MYDILGILKIKAQDIQEFLLAVKNKTIQVDACDGLYCPMRHDLLSCCAEIRTADSQSDLIILLSL